MILAECFVQFNIMTCNVSETNSCGEGGICVSSVVNVSSCYCSEGYVFNDGGLCEVPRIPIAYSAVASFCWLCFLLVLGKFLRLYVWFFQQLYLPASVIGGIIGLVVLQVARLDQSVSHAIHGTEFYQGMVRYLYFQLQISKEG